VAGGAVVPDPGARLPGRGAYLCPDPACGERALRRGALQRAFRRAVTIPDETLHLVT
jgi:predicted RNA-binding protein YlxR (DUF448 family)